MSEQLEPELERVARMLAAAGPLPDAPATLRERALRIPDGGSVPEQEGSAPEQEAAAVPIARRRFRRPRPIALAGLAAAVVAIAIVPAVAIMRDDGGQQRPPDRSRTASVRPAGRRRRERRPAR